jgi:hypothetical protein
MRKKHDQNTMTLGFFGALISIPSPGKLINQFLQSKYH